MTPAQERNLLRRCLAECKKRLDSFRREGNDIQSALTEADLNGMLDKLRELDRRTK